MSNVFPLDDRRPVPTVLDLCYAAAFTYQRTGRPALPRLLRRRKVRAIAEVPEGERMQLMRELRQAR